MNYVIGIIIRSSSNSNRHFKANGNRIKYDPEKVYSIYVNALTGELVPVDYVGFGHIALIG